MPLTRTLAQLRDAVQRTADVVAFTDKHPEAYVNDLVNRGCAALERQCLIINPEFKPLASTTITADGANTMFALPAGYRSLISVEFTSASDTQFKRWLTPYEMHERATLTESDTTARDARTNWYRVIGTNLELLPRPQEDDSALVWYATTITQLSANAGTINVMDRLDDYIIWWAAREIAQERENWERYDRLSASLGALVDDIRILARSIDLSHPARIVDTRMIDKYGRHYTRRGWR
jgi:hypothetical protein